MSQVLEMLRAVCFQRAKFLLHISVNEVTVQSFRARFRNLVNERVQNGLAPCTPKNGSHRYSVCIVIPKNALVYVSFTTIFFQPYSISLQDYYTESSLV